MNAFDELVSNFSRLPGIGKKSAIRMVNWVLKQDSAYIHKFSQNLGSIQEKIKPCSACGICSSPLRDSSIICVVEHSQDVSTIESHGEYKGLYQVLGGLIKPLEGIGPSQLAIPQLINRIKTLNTKEVIIATNPTVEGDTTALYVKKIIQEQVGDQVKISRLATGIPVGGDLEYIDKRTLSLSFSGRIGM